MPFRALFAGEPASALVCDDATWARLREATVVSNPPLVLPCCGRSPSRARLARGSSSTRRGRAPKRCPREGESEAHREIKKAVALALQGFEGWSAERASAAAAPPPPTPRLSGQTGSASSCGQARPSGHGSLGSTSPA